MKKTIMNRAWDIAREAVKNFGGSVKMYFAEALRMAWAESKNEAQKVVALSAIENELADRYYTVNSWCNYGKERLYINDHRRVARGYLELKDGVIVSTHTKVYLNNLEKYIGFTVDYAA